MQYEYFINFSGDNSVIIYSLVSFQASTMAFYLPWGSFEECLLSQTDAILKVMRVRNDMMVSK